MSVSESLCKEVTKHWADTLVEPVWKIIRGIFHGNRNNKYNAFTRQYPNSDWLTVNCHPQVGVALHREEVKKEIDELYGLVCHESDIEVLPNHESFSQAYNKLFPFFSKQAVVPEFLKIVITGLVSQIEKGAKNGPNIKKFCGCVLDNCKTHELLEQLRKLSHSSRKELIDSIATRFPFLGEKIDPAAYNRICKKLDLRVLKAIPFIPEDHISEKEKKELDGIQRRKRTIEVDEFNQFVKYEVCSLSYHLTKNKLGWMNPIGNMGRDPRNEGRKTMRLVDYLAETATSPTGLPPNSEVMVYYTGHSGEGGRWQLTFDDADNKWSRMALESLYVNEPEEVKRALGRFTQFWGIFDRLYVLQNIAQRMIAGDSTMPIDGRFIQTFKDYYDEHIIRHYELTGYFALLADLFKQEGAPQENLRVPAVLLRTFRGQIADSLEDIRERHNEALTYIDGLEQYQRTITDAITEVRALLPTLAEKQKDFIARPNAVEQANAVPPGGDSNLAANQPALKEARAELITERQKVCQKVVCLIRTLVDPFTNLDGLCRGLSYVITNYNILAHSVDKWLESQTVEQRRTLINSLAQSARNMRISVTELALSRDRLANLVRKRAKLAADAEYLVKSSRRGRRFARLQALVAKLDANQRELTNERIILRNCLESSTRVLAGFEDLFQRTTEEEFIAERQELLNQLLQPDNNGIREIKWISPSDLASIATDREGLIKKAMERTRECNDTQNYLMNVREKRAKQLADRKKLRDYLVPLAEEQKALAWGLFVFASKQQFLKASYEAMRNYLTELEEEWQASSNSQEIQNNFAGAGALEVVDKLLNLPFFTHLKPVAPTVERAGEVHELPSSIERIVEDYSDLVTESRNLVESLRNLEQTSKEIPMFLGRIDLRRSQLDKFLKKPVEKYKQLFDFLLVLDADGDELGAIGWALVDYLEKCKLDIEELEKFPKIVDFQLSKFAVRDFSSMVGDDKWDYFDELADYLMELRDVDGIHPILHEVSEFHLNRARHYEELARQGSENFNNVRNNSGEALKGVLTNLLNNISIDEDRLVKQACHEEIKHILRKFIKEWIRNNERRNYHLKFLLDTCFSGNWIEAFQQIIIDKEFKEIEIDGEIKRIGEYPISIQAACGPDEFTKIGFVVSTIRGHKWKQSDNEFTPMYFETHPIESPMIPELTMD